MCSRGSQRLSKITGCIECPVFSIPAIEAGNPIDALLTLLSRFYPLDHIFLGSIFAYLMLCTIHSFQVFGIRIAFLKLFSIERKRTPTNALLLMTFLLTFTALAFLWEITSVIAPRYATFGSQAFVSIFHRLT
jgi:hypothetical protein